MNCSYFFINLAEQEQIRNPYLFGSRSARFSCGYFTDSDNRIRLINSCRYPKVSLPVEDFARLIISS